MNSRLTIGLPLLLVSLSPACAETDDDPEEEMVSSSEDELKSSGLSPSEVARIIRDVGFPENQVGRMVCTAKWESSFRARATHKNNNRTIDRGLFQINSIHLGSMRGCPKSAAQLFSPEVNARCALAVWRAQGNRAWYGYRSHRSACDSYRAPASSSEPSTRDDSNDDAKNPNDDRPTCYSPTLGAAIEEDGCVQSGKTGIWYQCGHGSWYRTDDGKSGRFGDCSSSYPIGSSRPMEE